MRPDAARYFAARDRARAPAALRRGPVWRGPTDVAYGSSRQIDLATAIKTAMKITSF
jgi:hypothetical protein